MPVQHCPYIRNMCMVDDNNGGVVSYRRRKKAQARRKGVKFETGIGGGVPK